MENIIENNKIIADFMGVEVFRGLTEAIGVKDNKLIGPLSYDTSFDELMPVVKKITGIKYKEMPAVREFVISLEGYNKVVMSPTHVDGPPKYQGIGGNSPLPLIYNACVEFITWYNNQSK